VSGLYSSSSFVSLAFFMVCVHDYVVTHTHCLKHLIYLSGGVWVLPSGYVTFAPTIFEPSSEESNHDEEEGEGGVDDDMARKKMMMMRKKRIRQRRQSRSHKSGNDETHDSNDGSNERHKGNDNDDGHFDDALDDDDDYYYYFDDDVYFDDKRGGKEGKEKEPEDDWGDVGGFISAGGSVARASLSLTGVTWSTCANTKVKVIHILIYQKKRRRGVQNLE
jgi:hypothetical protein